MKNIYLNEKKIVTAFLLMSAVFLTFNVIFDVS